VPAVASPLPRLTPPATSTVPIDVAPGSDGGPGLIAAMALLIGLASIAARRPARRRSRKR
jgi:MYXO-CTERM domain-containing protein